MNTSSGMSKSTPSSLFRFASSFALKITASNREREQRVGLREEQGGRVAGWQGGRDYILEKLALNHLYRELGHFIRGGQLVGVAGGLGGRVCTCGGSL